MTVADVVKENEQVFQVAYTSWENTHSKCSWDVMWMCVNKACLYIAKSKCYGLRVRDLEDKVTDAVIAVMNKIKSGTHPKKLSSFCYLYTIGQLWSKKEQRWDQAVDFDSVVNNKAFSVEDNNIFIYEGETDEQ